MPIEYRPYVEEGIREWNKAFEKIGFRDAIAVRWEESGRDEFDPEDTNYCTFRWITGDIGYAMSCLRANPLTGEMIDGDVVFDAGFIRYWKQQYALLIGSTHGRATASEQVAPLAVGEVISPILAAKMGYGQPGARALLGIDALDTNPEPDGARGRPGRPELPRVATGEEPRARQPGLLPVPVRPAARLRPGRDRHGRHRRTTPKPADGKDQDKDGKDKAEKKKPEPKDELPEEFLGQAIKEIVMHEVGHSLGLRHNFKASTMLTADQLNDTAITHVKGLVGSVMDYSPINIAPKGKKQGDYYTDHDRPVRLLGHRVRLQGRRRRRGGRAEEDRRAGPGARPGLRDRRRLRSSTTTPTSIAGTSARTRASSARTGSRWRSSS